MTDEMILIMINNNKLRYLDVKNEDKIKMKRVLILALSRTPIIYLILE